MTLGVFQGRARKFHRYLSSSCSQKSRGLAWKNSHSSKCGSILTKTSYFKEGAVPFPFDIRREAFLRFQILGSWSRSVRASTSDRVPCDCLSTFGKASSGRIVGHGIERLSQRRTIMVSSRADWSEVQLYQHGDTCRVLQFPCLNDNYGYLMEHGENVIAVDLPADCGTHTCRF